MSTTVKFKTTCHDLSSNGWKKVDAFSSSSNKKIARITVRDDHSLFIAEKCLGLIAHHEFFDVLVNAEAGLFAIKGTPVGQFVTDRAKKRGGIHLRSPRLLIAEIFEHHKLAPGRTVVEANIQGDVLFFDVLKAARKAKAGEKCEQDNQS